MGLHSSCTQVSQVGPMAVDSNAHPKKRRGHTTYHARVRDTKSASGTSEREASGDRARVPGQKNQEKLTRNGESILPTQPSPIENGKTRLENRNTCTRDWVGQVTG
jgi:hypothetical protein